MPGTTPFIPQPKFDPHIKVTWEVRCGMLGRQRIKKLACPTPDSAVRYYAAVHRLEVISRGGRLWGRWSSGDVRHEHPFFVNDEESAEAKDKLQVIDAPDGDDGSGRAGDDRPAGE